MSLENVTPSDPRSENSPEERQCIKRIKREDEWARFSVLQKMLYYSVYKMYTTPDVWKFIDIVELPDDLLSRMHFILRRLKCEDAYDVHTLLEIDGEFYQLWCHPSLMDMITNEYSKDTWLTNKLAQFVPRNRFDKCQAKTRVERMTLMKCDPFWKNEFKYEPILSPALVMRGFLCISIVYWIDMQLFKKLGLDGCIVRRPDDIIKLKYLSRGSGDFTDLENQFKIACDLKGLDHNELSKTAFDELKAAQISRELIYFDGKCPKIEWSMAYSLQKKEMAGSVSWTIINEEVARPSPEIDTSPETSLVNSERVGLCESSQSELYDFSPPTELCLVYRTKFSGDMEDLEYQLKNASDLKGLNYEEISKTALDKIKLEQFQYEDCYRGRSVSAEWTMGYNFEECIVFHSEMTKIKYV